MIYDDEIFKILQIKFGKIAKAPRDDIVRFLFIEYGLSTYRIKDILRLLEKDIPKRQEWLAIVGIDDWNEWHKHRREFYLTSQRERRKKIYEMKKNTGWNEARKACLERDNHTCVITGATQHIVVHHINGDKSNNKLENLVTLYEVFHRELHWETRKGRIRKPDSGLLQKYQKYLVSTKYPLEYAIGIQTKEKWRPPHK